MDASNSNMVGVWFSTGALSEIAMTPHSPDCFQNPCLWHTNFTKSIQDDLVSPDNPSRTVSISDLELYGTVAHYDILASTVYVAHLTTCNLSKNNPSVLWRTKVSTTTTGPESYLLQLYALHQHYFCNKPEIFNILGTVNSMVDNCSRLWHLNESKLIFYLNYTYPQTACWKMIHLRLDMNSAVILYLQRKCSNPALYLTKIINNKRIGMSGVHFAPRSMQTHLFWKWLTLSHSFKTLDFYGVMDAFLPAADQTKLAQCSLKFGLSARHFPCWRPWILV